MNRAWIFLFLLWSPTVFAEADPRLNLSRYYDRSCSEGSGALPGQGICSDQTISFDQPDSEGIGGYEGRCGQTAWSNLITSYCKGIEALPDQFWKSDLTPGLRADTLRKGLQEAFDVTPSCPRRVWKTQVSANGETFLQNLNSSLHSCGSAGVVRKAKGGYRWSYPTPVLLFLGGEIIGAHWVTVVDIEDAKTHQCTVITNSWKRQYAIPCGVFAEMTRVPGLGQYFFVSSSKQTTSLK